jgi:hypothetical protein
LKHLENILVLEILWGVANFKRCLAGACQFFIQCCEALKIAGTGPNKNFFAGKLFFRAYRGASGDVTRISATFRITGSENSATASRSGVMVKLATATSPRPSLSASTILSRLTGIKAIFKGSFPVWCFLLMNFSKSSKAS